MEIDLGPPFYDNSALPPPINQQINQYIIISGISASSYSYVYTCLDINDNKKKAIKFIKFMQDKIETIVNEIIVMKTCNHKNIIQFQDFFRYGPYLCIILPYTPYRSISTILETIYKDGIPEEIAKVMMKQMLSAVQYLHGMSIWHRDIKPDNFLIFIHPPNEDINENQSENTDLADYNGLFLDVNYINIVLTDFGFVKFSNSNEKAKDFLGTFEYMAPEIIKDEPYDSSVDIWALGITLFKMLTNRSPWPSTTNSYRLFLKKVEKGQLNKSILRYNEVTQEAIDLIDNMCKLDPNLRYDASASLLHQWLKDQYVKGDTETEIGSAIGASNNFIFNQLV